MSYFYLVAYLADLLLILAIGVYAPRFADYPFGGTAE